MYRYYDYKSLFKPEELLEYLRKSQSDDPTLSVEEVLAKHEAILDEWALQNLGAVVPEENKYREVVSGETLKNRPEINKVLRLIESPKYKAVCVVEPQRLTRGSLIDIGTIMLTLKHTNTYVITPHKMYDLHDKDDWKSLKRELEEGNDFLEYTKTILNRGRELSVSQGNYIGSIPPYGYDKVWVKEGKEEYPTLVENKAQADVMRMIFDWYVNEDMGSVNICHRLDSMGIKPPKGEKWSPPAVQDMIPNIHYIGKVRWNYRRTKHVVEDGEIIAKRCMAKIGDYLIYEGKHEGIIPEALFYAAQEKIGRNHRAKPSTKIRNPLASILYCKCGRAMSLRTYRKDGKERAPARLLCDGQVHCQTGSVIYAEMIDKVCDILKESIADFEIRIDKKENDTAKIHAQHIKNLEKKLEDIDARELAQWEAQADPDPAKRMPQAIFQKLKEKLLKEKEETMQALFHAKQSMPVAVDYEAKIARFTDALEALQNPDVEVAKQNKLLKDCISKITYSREKPQRIKSQQTRYYDAEQKRTRHKSPLKTGANWTTPPIELDVKLKMD